MLVHRGYVLNPQHTLSADKTDVPTLVGDLRVGKQYMKELPVLGPPDGLLIEQLPPGSRSDAMIPARWARSCQNVLVSVPSMSAVW